MPIALNSSDRASPPSSSASLRVPFASFFAFAFALLSAFGFAMSQPFGFNFLLLALVASWPSSLFGITAPASKAALVIHAEGLLIPGVARISRINWSWIGGGNVSIKPRAFSSKIEVPISSRRSVSISSKVSPAMPANKLSSSTSSPPSSVSPKPRSRPREVFAPSWPRCSGGNLPQPFSGPLFRLSAPFITHLLGRTFGALLTDTSCGSSQGFRRSLSGSGSGSGTAAVG
mmetsp:Transcript_46810/g.150429  ORF Transcript_46810/g.150429 Transcript_46810/m.150429 type:complete len:231 (+) Transcript_46810:2872-3564(+)